MGVLFSPPFQSPSIRCLGPRIEFQRLSQNNRILYLPGRNAQKLVFACSAAYAIYPGGDTVINAINTGSESSRPLRA